MPENERDIIARLRLEWDKTSAQATQAALEKAKQGVDKFGTSAEQARKKLILMRETAERLQNAGMIIGGLGAAILGPLTLAAKKYLDTAKDSTMLSKEWARATGSIEKSMSRVGEVVVREALPYLKDAARLAKQAADFAEKHPEAIKAALGMGVTLAAVGGVIVAAAQAIRLAASVGLVGQTLGLGAGGAAAGGAAAGAIAAGPILALVAAVGGLVLLLKSQFGQTGLKAGGQVLSMAAGGFGMLFGKGNEWFLATAKALGVLEDDAKDTSEGLEEVAEEEEQTLQQRMKAYLNWSKADQELSEQYGEQRLKIVRDFEERQTQELEDFNRQRAKRTVDFQRQEQETYQDYQRQRRKTIEDFQREEATAEKDYYRTRRQMARDYGIEAARMEQDHQKEMRRMAQDHQSRLRNAAEANDVLAAVREIEDYNKERGRAEEDYQIEAQRRNADFARALVDLEENYRLQRQQRLEQLQLTLQENEENFTREREQRRVAFQRQMQEEQQEFDERRQREKQRHMEQLADLEASYNQERAKRRQALIDQMADLAGGLEAERHLRQQFTRAMLADLQAAINQTKGGGSTPPRRQFGGYVGSGMYQLHNNEYVLNPGTTHAMEGALGPLSQDRILAAVARGNQQSWNFNTNISGDMSEGQRAQLAGWFKNVIGKEIRNAFQGVM